MRLAIVDFEDILSICFGELGFDTEEFLSNLKYFIEIIDNNIGIRLYMYLKNNTQKSNIIIKLNIFLQCIKFLKCPY